MGIEIWNFKSQLFQILMLLKFQITVISISNYLKLVWFENLKLVFEIWNLTLDIWNLTLDIWNITIVFESIYTWIYITTIIFESVFYRVVFWIKILWWIIYIWIYIFGYIVSVIMIWKIILENIIMVNICVNIYDTVFVTLIIRVTLFWQQTSLLYTQIYILQYIYWPTHTFIYLLRYWV